MAKIGVSLKINTNMIDMARLFSGAKGNYLDATVFIDIDELDQYGNSGMITQDVSKEEKAQGVKGNILGNCKVFWNDSAQQGSVPAPQFQSNNSQANAPQQGYQQAPQQAYQQPMQQQYQQQAPQQPYQQAPQGYQQPRNVAPTLAQREQMQQQAPHPVQGFDNFDDDVPF